MTFGYFLTDDNQVYWCGPDFPDHTAEDEQPVPSWPIVTMFSFHDNLVGAGWGRERVEKHAKVLGSYPYNVGADHEDYAVLLEIPSAQAYRKLSVLGEQLDEEPELL